MFVRCKRRFKDGKEHRYWSVVENVRVRGGRVVQHHVLYLGEINDNQRAAWCRSIEVVEGTSGSRQMALFPEDREAPALDCEVVKINVAAVSHRWPPPRPAAPYQTQQGAPASVAPARHDPAGAARAAHLRLKARGPPRRRATCSADLRGHGH